MRTCLVAKLHLEKICLTLENQGLQILASTTALEIQREVTGSSPAPTLSGSGRKLEFQNLNENSFYIH